MAEFCEGLVLRQDARLFHVEIDGGVRACAARGKLFEELGGVKNPVAVGDRVLVSLDGDPGAIEEVLPRRNFLSRVASSHDPREQVLFANVDHMFVIASVESPGFSSIRSDRILGAGRWQRIPTTLILNKIDLDPDNERAAIVETYHAAGIGVVETSATQGTGVEELRTALEGQVSAFYGGSGVGKSTLLNALRPELDIAVGKISSYWKAGKHTTSHSQIHELAPGMRVIDTPGIRVFRLHGATPADLRGLYPEFERFKAGCRFTDCSHDHEPVCGVFDAVDSGELSPTRYASYVEMLDELGPPPEEEVPVVEP